VASNHGASPAQVALAYIRDKPGVSSVIVGARTADQLKVNLEAVALRLAPEEREELDEVSAPRLLYPYWWQALYDNRLGTADLSLLGRYVGSDRRELPGLVKQLAVPPSDQTTDGPPPIGVT
jgi:hypothetical protein